MTIEQVLINGMKKMIKNWEWWKQNGEKNEEIAGHLEKEYNLSWDEYKKVAKSLGSLKLSNSCSAKREWLSVSLMFYGLAIECYLKAVLIKNENINLFDRRSDQKMLRLHKDIKSHKITDFYKRIFINEKLIQKDEKIIKNLEKYITNGKYFFSSVYIPFENHQVDIEKIKKIIQTIKDKDLR